MPISERHIAEEALLGTAQTLEILGGRDVFHEDTDQEDALIRHIREGISVEALERLVRGKKVTLVEIDKLVIPRRTYVYRRKKFGKLTPEQSDRLVRLARVIAASEQAFGDTARAQRWLRRSTPALGGERPIDLLDTDEGARRVETMLGRIEHGIFS